MTASSIEQALLRKQQAEQDLASLEREELLTHVRQLRSLESFSPGEKVAAFDRLHGKAERHVAALVARGYEPRDGAHYLYEDLLHLALGKDVWGVINMVLK